MSLLIPVSAIHHDSRYYYDPSLFNPDRFSSEEVKKRPHYSFLPFGKEKFNFFVTAHRTKNFFFKITFQVKDHAIASARGKKIDNFE